MPVNLRTLVSTSGATIETWSHTEKHAETGERYSVTDYDSSVGNTSGDEKIWMLTTPNSAVRAHITITVDTDNEALIELRENPTIVSNGTALVIYNVERNSTNSSTVLAYKDVGVSYGTGTTLSYRKTGATGGPQFQIGGTAQAGGYTVLKQNEDYVLVLTMTNASTEAAFIAMFNEE